jgi:hypothetical protein
MNIAAVETATIPIKRIKIICHNGGFVKVKSLASFFFLNLKYV